jgi:hypothetical protein
MMLDRARSKMVGAISVFLHDQAVVSPLNDEI